MGGTQDVAKLLDFGLVRVASQNDDREAVLTRIGTIAGTPAFMSPEQAAGAAEVDLRSDIYSLGAVAYFVLTGHPPFERATPVETMAAHLSQPVIGPRELRPELPVDLEGIVVRCLEKEPSRRFSDAAALEGALAECDCCLGWSPKDAAGWWEAHDSAILAAISG
jgi:serine/threonine-protein kinase